MYLLIRRTGIIYDNMPDIMVLIHCNKNIISFNLHTILRRNYHPHLCIGKINFRVFNQRPEGGIWRY